MFNTKSKDLHPTRLIQSTVVISERINCSHLGASRLHPITIRNQLQIESRSSDTDSINIPLIKDESKEARQIELQLLEGGDTRLSHSQGLD